VRVVHGGAQGDASVKKDRPGGPYRGVGKRQRRSAKHDLIIGARDGSRNEVLADVNPEPGRYTRAS
jgi:hypothetical protein